MLRSGEDGKYRPRDKEPNRESCSPPSTGGGRFDRQLPGRGGRSAARSGLFELLIAGRYPARNPSQKLADVRAMLAANARGVQELHRMAAHFRLDGVHAYMQHVQDNARGGRAARDRSSQRRRICS